MEVEFAEEAEVLQGPDVPRVGAEEVGLKPRVIRSPVEFPEPLGDLKASRIAAYLTVKAARVQNRASNNRGLRGAHKIVGVRASGRSSARRPAIGIFAPQAEPQRPRFQRSEERRVG